MTEIEAKTETERERCPIPAFIALFSVCVVIVVLVVVYPPPFKPDANGDCWFGLGILAPRRRMRCPEDPLPSVNPAVLLHRATSTDPWTLKQCEAYEELSTKVYLNATAFAPSNRKFYCAEQLDLTTDGIEELMRHDCPRVTSIHFLIHIARGDNHNRKEQCQQAVDSNSHGHFCTLRVFTTHTDKSAQPTPGSAKVSNSNFMISGLQMVEDCNLQVMRSDIRWPLPVHCEFVEH